MLDFIKSEVKPDLIFWTGDNSAHNVWNNNNDEVTTATVNLTRMIQEHFDDTNVSVYPIHGNHDTWPVNVEDFSSPNSNININGFAELWLDWLNAETVAQFT